MRSACLQGKVEFPGELPRPISLLPPVLLSMVEFVVVTPGGVSGLSVKVACQWGIAKLSGGGPNLNASRWRALHRGGLGLAAGG